MMEILQNLNQHPELYVVIVTLSTKYNVNLTKQLSNGFKRSVYWNIYETIPAKVVNKGTNVYELLSASFPDIKILFILAFVIAVGAKGNRYENSRKYSLPRQ